MSRGRTTEVRCTACGTLNRVAAYSISSVPGCGRCGERLAEPLLITGPRILYRWVRAAISLAVTAIVVWGGAGLALFGAVWLLSESAPSASRQAPRQMVCTAAPPAEGLLLVGARARLIVPLTIETPGNANFLVKLVVAGTNNWVAQYFVYGGSALTVKAPAGTFMVRHASGTHWCDDARQFGENTDRQEGLEPIQISDGYHYVYRIIEQTDGNFRTRRISREEF